LAEEAPKATLDQHDLPVTWQDDVWLSWQIIAVQAEAVSHHVQHRSDDAFWPSVPAADAAHQERPLFS
jgi:hypothetical protein